MNKSLLCLILLAGTVGVSYMLFSQDSGNPEVLSEMSMMEVPGAELLEETTDIQVPDQVSMIEGPEVVKPDIPDTVVRVDMPGQEEPMPSDMKNTEIGMPVVTEEKQIAKEMPGSPIEESMIAQRSASSAQAIPSKVELRPEVQQGNLKETQAPVTPAPEISTPEEPVVNLPAVTTMTEESPAAPMAEDRE